MQDRRRSIRPWQQIARRLDSGNGVSAARTIRNPADLPFSTLNAHGPLDGRRHPGAMSAQANRGHSTLDLIHGQTVSCRLPRDPRLTSVACFAQDSVSRCRDRSAVPGEEDDASDAHLVAVPRHRKPPSAGSVVPAAQVDAPARSPRPRSGPTDAGASGTGRSSKSCPTTHHPCIDLRTVRADVWNRTAMPETLRRMEPRRGTCRFPDSVQASR